MQKNALCRRVTRRSGWWAGHRSGRRKKAEFGSVGEGPSTCSSGCPRLDGASCPPAPSSHEEIRMERELGGRAKAGIVDGEAPISPAATFCTIVSSERDTCIFWSIAPESLVCSSAIALPRYLDPSSHRLPTAPPPCSAPPEPTSGVPRPAQCAHGHMRRPTPRSPAAL
jgi:hypothetical protein